MPTIGPFLARVRKHSDLLALRTSRIEIAHKGDTPQIRGRAALPRLEGIADDIRALTALRAYTDDLLGAGPAAANTARLASQEVILSRLPDDPRDTKRWIEA